MGVRPADRTDVVDRKVGPERETRSPVVALRPHPAIPKSVNPSPSVCVSPFSQGGDHGSRPTHLRPSVGPGDSKG